jgi:glycosyltransferase involved in cell wall biosynthesis
MKVGYVTTYDSADLHAWSGTGTYMVNTLRSAGFQTEAIGNLKEKWALAFKMKRAWYAYLRSKMYLRDREPTILMNYATQVEQALAGSACDVVFSPGTVPIAYLQTKKPIVFWTDATFAGMVDFYPSFSNLCAESVRDGNRMEQSALSNCRLAIYSSDWAAETAITNYSVDPNKVKVVPFGANIACDRDWPDIERIVKAKEFDTCKLLFLGVDWCRKGGDTALAVASLLNQRGTKTELHVVGCEPPAGMPHFVKAHGFISKKTPAGSKAFDELMTQAHFLILPTIADCVPVVLAEANSYGLPALSTRVGGIPTVIRDSRNGRAFALDADPGEYCDFIQRLMASRNEYDELARSSFREYSERLNWSSAGKAVFDLVHEFCG